MNVLQADEYANQELAEIPGCVYNNFVRFYWKYAEYNVYYTFEIYRSLYYNIINDKSQ